MNHIWTLLVTTLDGHDSPNSVELYPTAEVAKEGAESDDRNYYLRAEIHKPIDWRANEDCSEYYGRGILYEYTIACHVVPEATS